MRRRANPRARAVARSSHWASSTATSTGASEASSRKTESVAVATVRASMPGPASLLRKATSSARRCTEWQTRPARLGRPSPRGRPSPKKTGTLPLRWDVRTTRSIHVSRPNPRPSRHNAVLPVPAGPARTSRRQLGCAPVQERPTVRPARQHDRGAPTASPHGKSGGHAGYLRSQQQSRLPAQGLAVGHGYGSSGRLRRTPPGAHANRAGHGGLRAEILLRLGPTWLPRWASAPKGSEVFAVRTSKEIVPGLGPS